MAAAVIIKKENCADLIEGRMTIKLEPSSQPLEMNPIPKGGFEDEKGEIIEFRVEVVPDFWINDSLGI